MSSTAPDRKRDPERDWLRWSFACGLLFAMVLAPAPDATAAQGGKTIKQSEEELERAKSRIESLNQKLVRERGQKSDLIQALEAAEKKLNEALAEIKRVRREIAAQNKLIADNQTAQAEARTRLDAQKEALSQQVRASYVMGNRAQTQLWLSQTDAARVGRVVTEFDYVNRARATLVAGVREEVDMIAGLESTLVEERGRLEMLELEQTQALASLQKSRDERKKTVARLDQQIAESMGELQTAQTEEKQLKELLDSLRNALSDIPMDLDSGNKPFAALKGKLGWPLRGPLLAEFGSPKAGGRLSWTGRWIGGRQGAPVRAVARGRVAYVGWLQRNGLMVILEHDGGYFTLYGHCSSVAPTAGEWVEAGQVIAAAGDTGGHDRPGVYLEIRQGSTALDARQWMGN